MLSKQNLLSVVLVAGAMTFANPAYTEEEKSAPAKKEDKPTAEEQQKSPAEQYPDLSKTVNEYMAAWQKYEFDKMEPYENFAGGENLSGFHYMQTFDANFGLSEWKITRIQAQENDEFLVLVLVQHNPPKHVAQFVPKGKKVRSTLRQYWKKQGDGYVHLFHVEKQRLLGNMFKRPEGTLRPEAAPEDEQNKPEEAKSEGI